MIIDIDDERYIACDPYVKTIHGTTGEVVLGGFHKVTDDKFVYVSLPTQIIFETDMTNKLTELEPIVESLSKRAFGWEHVNIIGRFLFPLMSNRDDIKPLTYLTHRLDKLKFADAIFFDEGWQDDAECRIEEVVAKEYNIPRLYLHGEGGD